MWRHLYALIFVPTRTEPNFYIELETSIIDSTVEHFETMADRGEGLSTLELEPGSGS